VAPDSTLGVDDIDEVERLAVAFTRLLRGAGIEVPLGSTLTFGEALRNVGLDRRGAVYWAGRSTLVKRPEDIDTYDRAFDAFWHGSRARLVSAQLPPTVVTLAFDSGEPADEPGEHEQAGDAPVIAVRWSPAEVLRERDFAAYTPGEFVEARKMMNDLRLAGALRPSRRRQHGRKAHGPPDVRRTVRDALRHGGEPIRRSFLAPAEQPRRLVLLLDVSGSMEPYARAFVRFLHAAVVGRRKVEAFALGTRLTRITRELSSHDPDAAIAAAAGRVADWAGGTRLGEDLRNFNDEWGVRGMARGAVVVVLSDGWDRGDPDVLREQMERLRRVAYRIVWVNPLKASPGYAPLAQGMAAALPYVDEFVEGHSLAALERVAAAISR
jgi:uncharacterized protein with von Willebrand factor type A (vWA) domain